MAFSDMEPLLATVSVIARRFVLAGTYSPFPELLKLTQVILHDIPDVLDRCHLMLCLHQAAFVPRVVLGKRTRDAAFGGKTSELNPCNNTPRLQAELVRQTKHAAMSRCGRIIKLLIRSLRCVLLCVEFE